MAKNFFLNLRPVTRAVIGIIAAAMAFLVFRENYLPELFTAILCWNAFAAVYLILDYIIIFNRKTSDIRKKAQEDDGSALFVFSIILLASFASMFAVLFLTTSGDNGLEKEAYYIPSVLAAMISAWLIVHTQYIYHYAHEYYDKDESRKKKETGGLDFPEDDEPDYLDFAYFSFCMGCTFQVSDVDVTSKKMRRIVMTHGLLAFFMNTFVVALTINLVAGLSE